MALQVGELFATLALKPDDFTKGLNEIRKVADSVTKSIGKEMSANLKSSLKDGFNAKDVLGDIKKELGNAKGLDLSNLLGGKSGGFDIIGKSLSGIAGIAGSAFGAIKSGFQDAMQAGMAFEAQMSTVRAVAFDPSTMDAGKIKVEFEQLTQMAMQLGATTKFSATEAGQGMEELARAGFDAQQTMAALPAVLDMAAAEGLSLAESSSIASTILRQFGKDATETGHVADVLASASASTNASITGLGQSFNYAGPVARQLGLEFEDVSAALSLLANEGIKGSMSGRNLATGLMRLAGPTGQAKNLMSELGITVTKTGGEFMQLPDIIDQLNAGMAGMSDAQKLSNMAMLVGKDNVKSWLPLLSLGSEELSKLSGQLHNSAGAAKRMADTRMNNLSGDMDKMRSAADNLGISLFQKLSPSMRAMVQAGTSAITALTPALVGGFGAIQGAIQTIAAAAIPGLTAAWNSLKPAIMSVISVITPLAATMGAVFVKIASQAASWGAGIVGQLAAGMAAAIQRVVAVLQYIGAVIRSWLAPHSPPKIVPELDEYGKEAGEIYAQGFAQANVAQYLQILGANITGGLNAILGNMGAMSGLVAQRAGTQIAQGLFAGWNSQDFSAFNEIGKKVEDVIRSFAESGAIPKEGMISVILGSREAIAGAINDIRQFGDVSEESITRVLESIGPVAPEVEGLVRSYFDLQEAAQAVAQAQQELNDVTRQFDEQLSPLKAQLEGINAEQERIRNMQRIEELQKKIADEKTSETDRQLALLELEEIRVQQQIDGIETEKNAAVDAAQEKLDAAKEAQDSAQAQYDAQNAQVEAAAATNGLLREQVGILKELADAAKAAASAGGSGGGGGGGLGGGLGGLGDLGGMDGEMPIPELPDLTPVTETFAALSTAIQTAKENVDSFGETFFSVFNNFAGITGILDSVGLSTSTLGSNFEIAKGYVESAMGSIGDIVQNVMSVVAGFIEQNGGSILSFFSSVWNSLSNIVSSALAIVAGIVSEVLASILAWFQANGAALTTFLSGTWEVISNVVMAALNIIEGSLAAVLAAMQGNWSGVWDAIKNTASAVWENVKGIISGVSDQIKGAWNIFTNTLKSVWKTTWDNVKTVVEGIIETIRAAIVGKADEAKTGFQTAMDAMLTKISGLVGAFTTAAADIGKSIIDGIVNGINAGIGAIVDAAKSVAQAAIDAVSGGLDSNSPSKEMIAQGEYASEGMAIGILNGVVWVVGAAERIASSILDTFQNLSNEAKAIFETMSDQLKAEMSMMQAQMSTFNTIEGLMPDMQSVEKAKDAYDSLVQNLVKQREKLINIDEQYANKRSSILEDLRDLELSFQQDILDARDTYNEKTADIQADYAEKLADINEEIAKLQSEQLDRADQKKVDKLNKTKAKLEADIARLEATAKPDDRLTQERIAKLKEQLQGVIDDQKAVYDDFEAERAEKLAKLQEKRLDLEETTQDKIADAQKKRDADIAKAQDAFNKKKRDIAEKLADLEADTSKDRQDALAEQAKLIRELAQAQKDYETAQDVFTQLQAISEKFIFLMDGAKQQLAELEKLDPERASKIYKDQETALANLLKLQEELYKEQSKGNNADKRKVALLQQQIDIQKQVSAKQLQAAKQTQIDDLTKSIQTEEKVIADEEKNKAKILDEKFAEIDNEAYKTLDYAFNELGMTYEDAYVLYDKKRQELRAQAVAANVANQERAQTRIGIYKKELELIAKIQDMNLDHPVWQAQNRAELPDLTSALQLAGLPQIGIDLQSILKDFEQRKGTSNTTVNNYTVNGTYQQNQNALSATDEIRLLAAMRG